MPKTLTILFKRFVNSGNVEVKSDVNVLLPSHLVISCENGGHRYSLSSCALHYGVHIQNGHYTSVIFKGNEVYEISDTTITNISVSWEYHVASSVYVAFYSAVEKQTVDQFQEVESKMPCPKQENIVCIELSDSASIQSETSEFEDNVIDLPNEDIENMQKQFFYLCDMSVRNKRVCTQNKHGYELYGKDFKSLEPWVAKKSNESYTLEDPGWLNDRIIDAYLSLCVKQCDSMGIQCFAFTTQFITKLRSVSKPGKEDEFNKMMSRHYRSVSFDLFDVMIIPINVGNGRHWCVIVIDPRKQLIFFYDPLQRGVQRVTLLEMIKPYFRELYVSRSYNVEINSKKFVTEFEIYWEDRFPIQEDFICCGVYILSYARYRLDLFNGMPYSEIINSSRPMIAFELVQGNLINSSGPININRLCIVPTTYEQLFGRMVTIRCSFIGEKPVKFEWIFKNMNISCEQTYSFLLKEDNVGIYVCRVTYADGEVLNSCNCVVKSK